MFTFASKEYFNDLYLAQPSKCFDCENNLPHGLKYLGQATKCFDCERQLVNIAQGNSEMAHFGKKTKCFDCEGQYMQNPFKQVGYSAM